MVLTNEQCVFARETEDESVFVAVNLADYPYFAYFDAGCSEAEDLISGEVHTFSGGRELLPYSAQFWKVR